MRPVRYAPCAPELDDDGLHTRALCAVVVRFRVGAGAGADGTGRGIWASRIGGLYLDGAISLALNADNTRYAVAGYQFSVQANVQPGGYLLNHTLPADGSASNLWVL